MRKTSVLIVMMLAFTTWSAAQYTTSQTFRVTNGPIVERVGDSSAVISWSTNVNVGTTLRYGTDPDNLDQAVNAPGSGLQRRVRINNLEPNTEYYFLVQTNRTRYARPLTLSRLQRFQTGSQEGVGTPAYGRDQYGNANGRDQYGRDQHGLDQYGRDQAARDRYEHDQQIARDQQRQNGLPQSEQYGNYPQVQGTQITNGPSVESATDRSAEITWATNANANTVLRYGTDRNNLNQTAQAPGFAQIHRVSLRNLQPGTTYFFRVESGQGSGTMVGQVQQFQTSGPGSSPPAGFESGPAAQRSIIISGLLVRRADSNSAAINWLTSVPASAVVRYGTDPNNMNQIAEAPWGGTDHTVTLTGLQPKTRYYIQVKSGEAQGQGTSSYSGRFTFTTTSAGAPAITNIQATPAQ